MKKAIVTILAILAVAGAGWYLFSTYLVSKLDGTGGVQAPLLQYSSEEGVTFQYPDYYELSSRTEGNGERQWDVLVLLPKGYVAPQYGEGPPAISLSIFDNQEELSLEQWVRGDARSNWKMIIDERASRPTVVDGIPALWYHYSGLYEVDSVAVAHNGKIYLFAGDWLEPNDQTRTDFNNLIHTVQFR